MNRPYHLPGAVVVIVACYLALGVLYALYTPEWQVPDEPAHYNYIRQLAGGRFPVMESGDYRQAQLDYLVAHGFPPEVNVIGIQYQDHQPPLYYLLATPIFWASGGSLLVLRLFSVVLGAGLILVAHQVGRRVFANRAAPTLMVCVVVAFIPQHVAMMAGVNNDALAELLLGAVLLVSVSMVSNGPGHGIAPAWFAGLLLGLAFLTKLQAYIAAPVLALSILMRWWDTGRDRRWLVRYSLGVLVPALLLGGIWWTRNLAVYGGLDVMGLSRHNAVVLGQPTTQAWLAQYGLGATLDRLVRFTFQSFWGMFGWMGLPMPTPIYLGLLVLSVAATLLLVSLAWSRARSIRVRPANYRPALVLGACALLGFLSFCWYNLHFVQHQGRYLFPALIPLAVLAGLALERLVAGMAVLLGGMLAVMAAGIAMRISTLVAASIVSLFAAVVLSLTPRRWHWLLPVAVGAALVALCLYALFGLVVPGLA